MTHRRFALIAAALAGCAAPVEPVKTVPAPQPRLEPPSATETVGTELHRKGDEIVVCGRLFHTGVPVVLWTDPGGYDAYRVQRRFASLDLAEWDKTPKGGPETPNRYGLRKFDASPDELRRLRGGGWDLPTLSRVVDQFVVHYDAAGTARRCFRVLHDARGLSVHFLLDLDGTIYQTLDVKERAWHATIANDRSVGIEIAAPGADAVGSGVDRIAGGIVDRWYVRDSVGPKLVIPPSRDDPDDPGFRTPDFVARPARSDPIEGTIHGKRFRQYDFTPQQYRALAHLIATLSGTLPKIKPDAPRGGDGKVLTRALTPEEFAAFQGVLGHYHIQTNKIDPGPAFDWEMVLAEVRRLGAR